jgi:hypothetical protein
VPFAILSLDQLAQGQAESVLASQTDAGPNDTILTDIVTGTGHALAFAIPAILAEEIEMYYQNARVRHSLSSQICHALSGESMRQSRIHVNIAHIWLEIVIVQNNDLKYANHMRWYEPNDVIYFIAALLENLELGTDYVFEFSGSAYKSEMHNRLVENLSIQDDQLVRSGSDDVSVLDLRTLGQCV